TRDEESGEGNAFTQRWGWLAVIDAVSETYRCSWEAATAMSVTEFLNVYCYRNDKIAEKERQEQLWRAQH
ncbi:MAG: hypothetical protein II452_04465, partial [Paludibacteraceae bacterium]|nr:hypothetical protein [Paludibacteraceae bacterium]